MPQISQAGAIYASQLFWLAIVFAAIYFGIGRAMVPKIERTVDDRNARISGDIAAAQTASEAARHAEETYQAGVEEARARATRQLAAAREQAAGLSAARLAEAAARQDRDTDEALKRIGDAKSAALNEIASSTLDAVEAIVTKLSGSKAPRALVEDRVRAELANG